MSEQVRRILILSSRYVVGGALRPFIAMLLLPLYTAYLTPADYGALALIMLTGALLSQVVETPLIHTLQRFYYHPDYRSRQEVFLFSWVCTSAVVAAVVALFYFIAADWLYQLIFTNPKYLFVVRIYSGVLLLLMASHLLAAYMLLVERAWLYNMSLLVQTVSAALVTTYFLAWKDAGLVAVLLGHAFGAVISILIWFPVLYSRVRLRFSLTSLATPLRFGYATIASGVALLVLETGDRYVLKIFHSTHEVGLYTLGCSIAASMPALFGIPVSNALWPTIRKLEDQPSEQRRFMRQTATGVCLVGVFVCLGLSLFAREVIDLFSTGDRYSSAWTVVPIVVFGHLLHLLSRFSQAGILLANRPGWLSISVAAGAILNIILAMLLVPPLGMIGAAVATLLSLIGWNILNLILCARFYQLHFDLPRLTGALALGGLLATGSLLAPETAPLPVLLGVKCLLLAMYPVLIALSGLLTETERHYLINTARTLRARGPLQVIRALV